MEITVPAVRGHKVKGQTTEFCVRTLAAGRMTNGWYRYSELRDIFRLLKKYTSYSKQF